VRRRSGGGQDVFRETGQFGDAQNGHILPDYSKPVSGQSDAETPGHREFRRKLERPSRSLSPKTGGLEYLLPPPIYRILGVSAPLRQQALGAFTDELGRNEALPAFTFNPLEW
jgi:hypothetical protein